jgi:hypothetical protein
MDPNRYQQPQQPAPAGPSDTSPLDSRPPHTPHLSAQPPKPKKPIGFIVVLIVIVLAVGGGVYWLTTDHNKKPAAKTSTTSSTGSTKKATNDGVTTDSSGNKTYKSTTLNVQFTYPSDWEMSQNADKSEVTLTSPQVTYTTKDGKSAQGPFVLRLRNGVIPDAMIANIQAAVATKDSEVIAYKTPVSTQRQYTNISWGGNGTNTTFFMVTGGTAFKSGQAFGSNIDLNGSAYVFAGGFGSDASDALAFDAVPTSNFVSSDSYQQAEKIIESMQIY